MVDHQKAHRWIHARLDGALPEGEAVQLEQHFQECDDCREYAYQIERLDRNLQQEFALRRQTEVHLPHGLPLITLPVHSGTDYSSAVVPRSRAAFLSGLFRTAVYIGALIGLTGGLIFLFSSPLRPPTPGAPDPAGMANAYPALEQSTPYPVYPVSTPFRPFPGGMLAYPGSGGQDLWPQGANPYPVATFNPYIPYTPMPTLPAYPGTEATVTPVFPPTDIIPSVERLAQKNVNWYNQAGWVYSLERDLQPGETTPISTTETWYHAPQEGETCAQYLQIVKDNKQDQAIVHLYVQTTDGLFGDLVALRGTSLPVTRLHPGSQGCILAPEATPAGHLAQQIAGSVPNLSVRQVRGWSKPIESGYGEAYEVIFERPSGQPPLLVLEQVYDPEKGLLLEEQQRLESGDGKLYSQTATHITYQAYPILPDQIMDLIEQMAAELRNLANSR